MLFKLRHKAPNVGIVEDLIELDDPTDPKAPKPTLADAEKVGRALCNAEPGYLYIAVSYAILNKRPKVDDDDEFRAVRKAS